MKKLDGLDYSVTKCGKVWSHKSNKFMRLNDDGMGYLCLNLCDNGIQKKFKVHRLMRMAYLHKKNGVVNHIDGNKKNNHINNLEIVSQSQNVIHAYKNKLKTPVSRKNGNCHLSKIKYDEIDNIVKILFFGYSSKDMSNKYNISSASLCRIFKDKMGFGLSRKKSIFGRKSDHIRMNNGFIHI